VNLIQAIVWNVGICCFDAKGKPESVKARVKVLMQNREAERLRSSDEIAVTAMERRESHCSMCVASQPKGRSKL